MLAFGFFGALYNSPRGISNSWTFESFPRREFNRLSADVRAVERWEEKKAAEGGVIAAADVPDVARVDHFRVWALVVGAGVMGLFLFLRSRIFWWPHPIGLLMWAGPWAILQMWFSYFLGWLCKVLIVKFGGFQIYGKCRRFFVGLIVGELLATVLWIAIAWLTGTNDTYPMHFN